MIKNDINEFFSFIKQQCDGIIVLLYNMGKLFDDVYLSYWFFSRQFHSNQTLRER